MPGTATLSGARSPAARPVIDHHRLHFAALPQDQCRQKSMHVIEIGEIQEKGTWKQLQSATCVRGAISEKAAAYGVGDA